MAGIFLGMKYLETRAGTCVLLGVFDDPSSGCVVHEDWEITSGELAVQVGSGKREHT